MDGNEEKPLSKDDLYGRSEVTADGTPIDPPPPEVPMENYQNKNNQDMKEEINKLPDPLLTPELPPAQDKPLIARRRSGINFGSVILFIFLFAAGIGISMLYNRYLASRDDAVLDVANRTPEDNNIMEQMETMVPSDQYQNWKSYDISKYGGYEGFEDMSFKLPDTMLEPICDGANCPSRGTYMPGGSRFTISIKPDSPAMNIFPNVIITDAGGKKFDTKEATVSATTGVKFNGEFNGSTAGGYRFTKMSGVLFKTGNVYIEMNHFSPSGINADFEKDQELFEKILGTIIVSEIVPTPTPLSSILPSNTPQASPF